MRSDKSDTPRSFSRQKLVIGGLILVVVIIIWQVIGLFRSESTPPEVPATPQVANTANTPPNPMQATPKPAEIVTQAPSSERELELMRMQKETQAKYLAALDELQMLKVAREIAETNQAIMSAKLATVTAEKGIVNLLIPQATVAPDYSKVVAGGTQQAPKASGTPQEASLIQEVNYTVISVSLLQYRWGAVLGYQGNLYNVHVGDVLPPDGSTVIAISKTGVVLERQGVKKKISLVPAI